MKKIITILGFLFIIALAGCTGDSVKTTARLTISSISSTSTSITFKAQLADSDSEIIADTTKIQLLVDGNVVKELVNENIPKTQARVILFEGLERETEHVIKITAQIEAGEVTLWTNPSNPTTTLAQGDAEDDPLIITTTQEFFDMENTKYYRLANDLDFNNESFIPLFSSGSAFSGGLDGDGHKIMNISISDKDHVNKSAYLAIFQYVSTATIKNITFENITIDNSLDSFTGTLYSGIIAARVSRDEFVMDNVTIINSHLNITHNKANITSSRSLYVGLAIGMARGSITNLTIEDSSINVNQTLLNGPYNNADILTAGTYVGGAVGLFEHDTGERIQNINIDATINVTVNQEKAAFGRGALFVGGVIGAYRSDMNMGGLYANVDITINHTTFEDTEDDKLDSIYAGGLVGFLHKSNLYDGYYTGNIDIQLSNAIREVYTGALVGYAQISSLRLVADANITVDTQTDAQTKLITGLYNYVVSDSTWKPEDNLKIVSLIISVDETLVDVSNYQVITTEELKDYFNSEWLINLLS